MLFGSESYQWLEKKDKQFLNRKFNELLDKPLPEDLNGTILAVALAREFEIHSG